MTKPTKDLKPHPALAVVPMIPEVIKLTRKKDAERADSMQAEWDARVADIRENGVLESVKVNQGLIVDGRHRWTIAEAEGVEYEIEEVPDEAVEKYLCSTVVGRRHWSKSQIAWLAVSLNPDLLKNKQGETSKNEVSQESVASEFGVSAGLMGEAVTLYRTAKEGGKRQFSSVEAMIFSGVPVSRAKCGLGGKVATEHNPRPKSSMVGVRKVFGTLTTQLSEFDNWTDEERGDFEEAATEVFNKVPKSARQILTEVLNG